MAASDSAPLHSLLDRLSVGQRTAVRGRWSFPLGSMQFINDQLEKRPVLDFFNASLRGVGQCAFVNNPISGLLILLAMALQWPFLAAMGAVGAMSGTLAAIGLKLNVGARRNGIYGLNGFLITSLLALFGGSEHAWHPFLLVGAVLAGMASTWVFDRGGTAFAVWVGVPPIGVVFNAMMFAFMGLVLFIPQAMFHLGEPPLPPPPSVDTLHMARSVLFGIGQIYFAEGALSVGLVILAFGICSPMTLIYALLGSATALPAVWLMAGDMGRLYAGLMGFNSALVAIAIGGVFFAPNRKSLILAMGAASVTAFLGVALERLFGPYELPILSLPFALVTVGILKAAKHWLPSLVPVALHAIATPEEHRRRFVVSRDIIQNFRADLAAAGAGKQRTALFDSATPALGEEIRRRFAEIDTDGSGELSLSELAASLTPPGQPVNEEEYRRIFTAFDHDGSGAISEAEFGELLLRHARLMGVFQDLLTYFLPIDVNGDDSISMDEMNLAFASVDEPPFTQDERATIQKRKGEAALSWNEFVELLLVA